jgi:hypothetical protein
MPARDLVFQVLGIDKSASKTFNDVADAVDRFGKRATAAMAALAGASAASSLAVGGALAALPVAFAAVGAAALRNNAQVRESFGDLRDLVSGGLTEDAAVLTDAFVNAAHSMADAYAELRPQMRDAFAASIPAVEHLTAGVIGFAREAMPGAVTAARSSEPVFVALEHVLVATGRGAGEMFEIMAAGSSDAGRGIAVFGDLAEGVLPNVGGLLVDLSSLWAEHGDQAVRVIVKLTGVVEDLGGHALPVVSAAMGVALDVLTGALAVVGPLADQLGPLIGIWLSLGLAMRAVGGASAVIAGVTASVAKFQRATEAASTGGVGKFSLAARGMLGVLGGPFGAAVLVAGVALAAFGQQSEDAARQQRGLADALRESAGEYTAEARELIFNSKQYQAISRGIEAAGIAHSDYIDALISGGPVLDQYVARLDALTFSSATGESTTTMWRDMTGELRAMMAGAAEDAKRTAEAVDSVSRSMFGGKPGADALSEAIKALGDKTATTADHVDALNDAWRRLFGVQLTLDDAVAGFEGGLDDLRESLTSVTDGVASLDTSMVNARGGIDLSVAAGRTLHTNLSEQGEAYRALAATVHDTVLQRGGSEAEATAAVQVASRDRRAQFETELRSIGFTAGQVQVLADKYLGLPDAILTVVRADVTAAQNVITSFINKNDGRTIFLNIKGQQVGMAVRQHGGPLDVGRWTMTGEAGPELIVPQQPGMVLPAQHTAMIMSAIAAARPAAALAYSGHPATVAATAPTVHLHVTNAGVIGSQRDLENWLAASVDRLIRHGRLNVVSASDLARRLH